MLAVWVWVCGCLRADNIQKKERIERKEKRKKENEQKKKSFSVILEKGGRYLSSM
jgi:DNA replication protein DnaD